MEHAPVDYKLLISLIAVYGVLLLYVYQFGFFSIVGFEHAGLTSPLDIWSNAAFILAYAIPTAMASLLVIMLIQYSAQFGFNVVRWIADHEPHSRSRL